MLLGKINLRKYYILFNLLILFYSGKVSAQNGHLKFGFEIEANTATASIPFHLINNLMVVDVLLEGIVPLKFIIDTGVTNTVLIEKTYADVLNIMPDRKLTLVGAAGGREVEAYIVNSVNIKLDGIAGTHIPLLVLAEDYLNLEETMGIHVHGILGYDLFKNFVVKIDYANQMIIFFKPERFNRKLWWYREMPLSIENTKPYTYQKVKLSTGEQLNAKLMIDTGASHSLMLHQNRDSTIRVPEKNIRDILGAGIAGTIEGHVGRIEQLNMEDYVLGDVIARFPDRGSYAEVIESTGRHGTIGGGVLKRFSIFLDYQNEVMYVKKNRLFRNSFDYDMSGMTVVAKGELFLKPYYEIEEVRAGTPAALAGIKEKDVIISLNGYLASDLNMSKINEILTSKVGRKIKLKIKRGEETFSYEFRLEQFI